ncbi:hypothetical protein ABPG74_007987 [Tetrahymena malaccensis]
MNRELPEVKCQKHKQNAKYLLINEQPEENIFLCSRCKHEKERTSQKVLELSDFFEKKIMVNWPYVDDNEILTKIDSIVNLNNEEYRKDILVFFDKLKVQINQKLDLVCKEVIQKEEDLSEKSQDINQRYLELFQIGNILQIMYNQNDDSKAKSQKIQEIFNKLKENQKENTDKLKQYIEETGFKGLFEIDNFREIQESILNQMNLFKQENDSKSQIVAKQTQKFMKNQGVDLKKDNHQLPQIEIGGNLEYILKFVSNKANQCKKEYLITLENELLSIQDIINNLKICKFPHDYPNEQEDIDLSDLSIQQVKGIKHLTEKMRSLKQQYEQQKLNQNQISSSLQPSSKYVINNIFQHDKLLQKSKIDQIESYLRSFPIFELCNFIDPSVFDFQIQPSTYLDSQKNLRIQLSQQNKYQIMNQSHQQTISYIKLNQEKSYNLCLQFNPNNKTNPFYIGLVSYQDKDTLTRNTSILQKLQSILKSNRTQSLIQLEIQFCIKNKQFFIREKSAQQQEASTIDFQLQDNVEYFLAIHLDEICQSIEILEFQEFNISNPN